MTVRRSAIRTRRQEGKGPSPRARGLRTSSPDRILSIYAEPPRLRTPPERGPLGSKGAEPLLVSLQCYTLGSLAHVTGHCVKFGVVRTEASPVPSHGLSHSPSLHAADGAKLAGFDRFGPGEGGARHRRAGTDGVRSRYRLPSHSLLNLRDGDAGLSFLVVSVRPVPAGGALKIPWAR